MRKIKFIASILISLMSLTAGCGGKESERISTVPPEEETISGPVLIIDHVGKSRTNMYQLSDKIDGEVPISFGEDNVIEGFGYGTFESSEIAVDTASISSTSIQETVFNFQGRMTDDCELEITITEERLPGTKTSGYSYANYPQRGRPGEHSAESFTIIPGSEFIEGTFTIPFKSTLYTTKATRDSYDWTWTFQIQGIDEHEEVHGCTFASK
jgi:hypothetical protein